ncbi:MAG: metallophosphoesterase [Flavobacteriaceae bacterium]
MKFNRRSFILKLVLGIIGLVVIDAFWLEKYFIEWKTFDISNGEIDIIKAIQLSDLHLQEIKSFHRSIAERINQERPDVVFITGDTITRKNKISLLNDFLDLLDNSILKIAILGNKEYSGRVDIKLLKKTYSEHNCVLLINESYVLHTKNRKINILGIDDYVYGSPDFSKAVDSIDRSLTTVVLNHCPAYREEIDRLSMGLEIKPIFILAGHTHGGQITFFGNPLFTPYGSGEYVKGWYNNKLSKMYVSKGIGTAILPIRFGARAEATLFYI